MISKEVQLAVDEIHRERSIIASLEKANSLQTSQLSDLNARVSALQAGAPLSDDDKKALLDAINEAGETSDELATAIPANTVATDPGVNAQPSAGTVAPIPPPNDPDAPRPDPIAGTGQNGSVPLMPNSAFDPGAGNAAGPVDPGQPNQPAAIETAGGFVLAGGGTVQRDLPDVHPSSEAGVAATAAEEPVDPATLESQGSGKPPASPVS